MFPRRHKFSRDLLYIEKQNFQMDLKAIPLSFAIAFRGKRAVWNTIRGRWDA